MDHNNVNHPKHYQTKAGIEAIDVMKAFTEHLSGVEAVDTAQILKYICRWKQKNGLEDLKKAKYYLEDLIKEVEVSTDDDVYAPFELRDVYFITAQAATKVLTGLIFEASRFEFVPVNTYYVESGLYADDPDGSLYGWSHDDLIRTQVKRTRDGYVIDFPKPIKLPIYEKESK